MFANLYSLLSSYGESIQDALDDTTLPSTLRQLLTIMVVEKPATAVDDGVIEYKIEKLRAQSVIQRKRMITERLAATTSTSEKQKLLAELQRLMNNS